MEAEEYQERRAKGICTRCDKEAVPGKAECARCRSIVAASNAKRRRRILEAGNCLICLKPRGASPSKIYCAPHLEMHRVQQRKHKTKKRNESLAVEQARARIVKYQKLIRTLKEFIKSQ